MMRRNFEERLIKPPSARRTLCVLLTVLILMPTLWESASLFGQRGGRRRPNTSASVKRSSPALSGSTQRATRPAPQPNRSRPAPRPAVSNRPPVANTRVARPVARPGVPARNVRLRQTVRRRPAAPGLRARYPARRVYYSRRYRAARWRHHRYWHHRSWYTGWWVARAIIRTTAFIVILNSPQTTTYTVTSVTYYHYNPWYRRVLYKGEEGYVQTSAPVGFETRQLPDGAETVDFEGTTYHYHEAAFYQGAAGGGYIVAQPPVGAEVSSIPADAVPVEEADSGLYVFDKVYFTKDVNDSGREIYRVEPQPGEEEMDEMPSDAVTFVADGETYYYVNYNLYVKNQQGGRTEFVNGEPEIGAQLNALPQGATTIEESGKTYYQFDMVFFEEVEDEKGNSFYEVVGSPDGSEAIKLKSD